MHVPSAPSRGSERALAAPVGSELGIEMNEVLPDLLLCEAADCSRETPRRADPIGVFEF